MKEEALKLADQVDEGYAFIERTHLSGVIRRLVEELDKQEHCCPDCGCHFVGKFPFNYAPQTKPLSDEEIYEVINKHWNREYGKRDMLTLCRALLRKAQDNG